MRQDAVMQQVFTVMNSLLRKSKEARRRKLNIRTYKVNLFVFRGDNILVKCVDNGKLIVTGRTAYAKIGNIAVVREYNSNNESSGQWTGWRCTRQTLSKGHGL